MPRKTIAVRELVDMVNRRLAIKDSSMILTDHNGVERTVPESMRLSIASLLEEVLHATGNYKGFGYQAGVIDFTQDPPESVGDETRRTYRCP